MKKQHAPDLFDGQPDPAPRLTIPATAPTDAAGLAQLRATVWEAVPVHERGTIRGQQCLSIGGSWPALATVPGEELLDLLRAAQV